MSIRTQGRIPLHPAVRGWGLKLMAAGVLAAAGGAWAVDVPPTLAGVTVVTAEQARKNAEAGALLIDTRVANEYVELRIKGARSIPYKEKSPKAANFDPKEDRFELAKLPADKNAALIFYCNGPECWKSYKAAKVTADAGYRQVQWLRGGIPEWKAKGFPVE